MDTPWAIRDLASDHERDSFMIATRQINSAPTGGHRHGSRSGRAALALPLALIFALGALLVPVGSAQAAAGCYAASCNGKDPEAMNCDGATTKDEFSTSGGHFRIEMRVSAVCSAAWTRITTKPGILGNSCNLMWAQTRSYTPTDERKKLYAKQAVCNGSGTYTTGGQTYTKMVSFQDYVRSCWAYDSDENPQECTNRH
jgi:Protein of unknown function (DUF2690)